MTHSEDDVTFSFFCNLLHTLLSILLGAAWQGPGPGVSSSRLPGTAAKLLPLKLQGVAVPSHAIRFPEVRVEPERRGLFLLPVQRSIIIAALVVAHICRSTQPFQNRQTSPGTAVWPSGATEATPQAQAVSTSVRQSCSGSEYRIPLNL